MARIAVIGGGGYVGLALCRELARRGHDTIAVIRAHGMEALHALGVRAIDAPALPGERFDAVVNLAHPKTGPAYGWSAQNEEIFRTIASAARDASRVVQVCTLGVFGDRLEQPVMAERVPWRRAIPYVECKLALQDQLLDRFAGRSIEVVRLGNVWGPRSPMWTARLVARVAAGLAVGVEGEDGFSNVTDVANTASYLAHVLESAPATGPRFHHLAELGDARWSFWTDRIAAALGRTAILAPRRPEPAIGPRLLTSGPGGSVARSLARLLPERLRSALRALSTPARAAAASAGFEDAVLLGIMSCPRRFAGSILPGWSPPISRDAAWDGVARWMDGSAESSGP